MNTATAFAYPEELRATRDLLRRRTHLVRRRAQTLTHIQIVNHQLNLPPFEKKLVQAKLALGETTLNATRRVGIRPIEIAR